jgi:hypothetical protein
MKVLRAYWRRLRIITVLTVGSWMMGVNAQAGGTIGTGSFGGARVGGIGVFSGYSAGFGGLPRGSSVINHGGTGFTIYSQRGVTRVIGQPQVSKKILLPDGRSAQMIGDGRGGAYIFGAPGNHRILGNRRLFGDDGP